MVYSFCRRILIFFRKSELRPILSDFLAQTINTGIPYLIHSQESLPNKYWAIQLIKIIWWDRVFGSILIYKLLWYFIVFQKSICESLTFVKITFHAIALPNISGISSKVRLRFYSLIFTSFILKIADQF